MLETSVDKTNSPLYEIGIGDLNDQERQILRSFDDSNDIFIDTTNNRNTEKIVSAMIAQGFCRGEKMLLISQSDAKVKLVKEQLRMNDLNSLLIDCFNSDEKKICKEISESLNQIEINGEPDLLVSSKLNEISEQILSLCNDYRKSKNPFEKSLIEVIVEKLKNQTALNFDISLNVDEIQNVAKNKDDIAKIVQELVRLKQNETSDSPWNSSIVETEEDCAKVLEILERLFDRSIPELLEQIKTICEHVNFKFPTCLDEWFETIDLLQSIRKTLDKFESAIFSTDLTWLKKSQEENSGMSFFEKRRASAQLKDLIRPGIKIVNLKEDLELAIEQQISFSQHQNGTEEENQSTDHRKYINLPENLLIAINLSASVKTDINLAQNFFNDSLAFSQHNLSEVKSLLSSLISQSANLKTISQIYAINQKIKNIGGEKIAESIIERRISNNFDRIIDQILSDSIFKYYISEFDEFKNQNGNYFHALLKQFYDLDKKHVEVLSFPTIHLKNQVVDNLSADYFDEFNFAKRSLMMNKFRNLQEFHSNNPKIAWQTYSCAVSRLSQFSTALEDGEKVDTVIFDGLKNLMSPNILHLIDRTKRIVVIADEKSKSHIFGIDALSERKKTARCFEFERKDRNCDFRLIDFYNRFEDDAMKYPNCAFIKSKIVVNELQGESSTLKIVEDVINWIRNSLHKKDNPSLTVILRNEKQRELFRKVLMAKAQNNEEIKRQLIRANELKLQISIAISTDSIFQNSKNVIAVVENNYSDETIKNLINAVDDSLVLYTKSVKNLRIANYSSDQTYYLEEFFKLINKIFSETDEDFEKSYNAEKIKKQIGIMTETSGNIIVNSKRGDLIEEATDEVINYIVGQISSDDLKSELNFNLSTLDEDLIALCVHKNSDPQNKTAILFDSEINDSFSLRNEIRFRGDSLKENGWNVVWVSLVSLALNPSIEIARIKDSLLPKSQLVSSNDRNQSSHLDQRAKDILREVPPHSVA